MQSPDKSNQSSIFCISKLIINLRSFSLFLCATATTAIILELYLNAYQYFQYNKLHSALALRGHAQNFAVYGKVNENHLEHIINVLTRLGYERVPVEDEWQLLWAHEYPFRNNKINLKGLRKNQIVNHFPGCGFITSKVELSTSKLPFIPQAFRLPYEKKKLYEFRKKNPNALFVEKHNEHRQIKIRSLQYIISKTYNNTFLQEYVQNPYLINGYKFDIGVYVVITSIAPLRLYIYSGDVLFRFCSIKYHPFDEKVVNKYIVGDDYLPIWKIPSLEKYYNQYGSSMRDSFDAFIRDQGFNPDSIWKQAEHVIRATVLSKEKHFENILQKYETRNFFELMRFDMILDNNLKLYLMEANMSPNLSSTHFKRNSILYEQILYSVFNLMGIATPLNEFYSSNKYKTSTDTISMERNLATNLNDCQKNDCHISCHIKICKLCVPCLRESEYEILLKTYHEHILRMEMKRIFPKPIINLETYNIDIELQNLTPVNKWLTQWFYNKCQSDYNWCF